MRPLIVLGAIALTAALAGCAGGGEPAPLATPPPSGFQANAAQALAPVERVDYATVCPSLVERGHASLDLITEFLDAPQVMANDKAQTASRFDGLINQLGHDAKIAPLPLVASIETQQNQLRELRDFALAGGTLEVDLNDFKVAAGQTVLQCGGQMPPSAVPPPTTPTPPPGPAGTISQGTHVVGTDIQAGTYKTSGPAGSSSCYWARLKDTSGDLDAIIANNIGDGPATVTIKSSDGAFETSGCILWAKVS